MEIIKIESVGKFKEVTFKTSLGNIITYAFRYNDDLEKWYEMRNPSLTDEKMGELREKVNNQLQ